MWILFLLLIGCAHQKEFPYRLEDWINSRLPYDEEIFNCRHRAKYAESVLDENGYKAIIRTETIGEKRHNYVFAFKDGKTYEILRGD